MPDSTLCILVNVSQMHDAVTIIRNVLFLKKIMSDGVILTVFLMTGKIRKYFHKNSDKVMKKKNSFYLFLK